MPVKIVSAAKPLVRNGVGSFILQCKKITLQYCNWGGSSSGMRQFLSSPELKTFAAENPKVEFVIEEKSGHPQVIGEYVSGRTKAFSVRNYSVQDVIKQLEVARDSSGKDLQKYKQPVKSLNESVRGVWSPVHAKKEYRFQI